MGGVAERLKAAMRVNSAVGKWRRGADIQATLDRRFKSCHRPTQGEVMAKYRKKPVVIEPDIFAATYDPVG